MGIGYVSTIQTSLAPRINQDAKMVRSIDLRVVMLLEDSLSMELVDDKVIMSNLKNIGLNLIVLPNKYLHTLQIGMTAELQA